MTVFGTRYLVDTNVLSQLQRHRRASKFFQANSMIPTEVLHEASGFPDVEVLGQLEYRTTPSVLRWLKLVMATASPGDSDLINLYSNQGGADPLMIACALDARDREMEYVNPLEWAIVTGDRAVRAKAEEFEVRVATSAQFREIIDRSETAC